MNIGTFTDDTLVAVARRHPSVIHRSIVAVTKYFYNKIFLYFHPGSSSGPPVDPVGVIGWVARLGVKYGNMVIAERVKAGGGQEALIKETRHWHLLGLRQ